jgi:hypothetical protein
MNIRLTIAALQKEHNPAMPAPQKNPREMGPVQSYFLSKCGLQNSHFTKTRSAGINLSRAGNLCLFRRRVAPIAAEKSANEAPKQHCQTIRIPLFLSDE